MDDDEAITLLSGQCEDCERVIVAPLAALSHWHRCPFCGVLIPWLQVEQA